MKPSWQLRQQAQTFGTLAQITRTVGGLAGMLNDAQRVSQVNQQLAYLEQAYKDYNESLQQKMFDARGELEITGPSGGQAPSVVQKPFGQASLADIEADEDKFFQSQLEYINKNTTNRDARREMIQHLNMKNIQNKKIISGQWNVAADHEAMAGLNKLSSTLLLSNDPWEVKVNKMSIRLKDMERVGRIWPEDADAFLAKFTAAAQYSFARDGAMTIMKQTGDPAAGEAWLAENTPFYDGNPEVRASVLQDVRQEWEYQGKIQDLALDDSFGDLYSRTDTLQKAEMALKAVDSSDFFQGDNKVKWTDRFTRLRELFINDQGLTDEAGKKAWDDQMEQNGYKVKIAMYQAELDGKGVDVRRGILDSQLYAEGGSRILLKDAASMYADLTKAQPTGLKFALAELNARIKNDPKLRAEVGIKLVRFSEQHPDATDEQYMQATENFINEHKDWVLNTLWSETKEITEDVLKQDKRLLTNAEKMTGQIDKGGFTAITEEWREDLLLYSAYMFRLAKQRYPDYNFVSVSPDTSGTETGDYGAAVLLDNNKNKFRFKLEDNKLVLYGYLGTHGNLMDKSWVKIGEPGAATGAEQAQEIIRKQEREAEQEELAAGREVGRELYREIVPELRGAGKAPEIVFEDWFLTVRGWYNKKTGFATNPDLIKRLNELNK